MTRHLFYDRDGEPLDDPVRWAKLKADLDYTVVAQAHIGKHFWVSTIWLGTDMNFAMDGGRPLIFETGVFKDGCIGEVYRYATRAEAEVGHRDVCEQIRLIEEMADK